jgi:hypothetical protein
VIDRQQTGRRTIHRATTVSRLYGEICGLTLIRYDRPVTTSCPVPRTSIDVYHLVFARGTRKLLRVTEKANGCQFLSVDGRPDLGTAYLGQGLILPAGTPTAA